MTLHIEDILSQDRTLIDVSVSSKKKLLEFLAEHIAGILDEASANEVYERLLERERMGSTGIGHGIAIPHCRLLPCNQALGILIRLDQGIDYDSIDGEPVDLVFALLVPAESTDEHLQILATLATNLSQKDYREALRKAPNQKQLYTRAIAEQTTQ